MIKFSFTGSKILQNRIDKANAQLESIILGAVEHEANYIETMSKLNAPYEFGKLTNSQYKKPEIGKNKRAYKIGFGAKYAPFQEFGTLKRFKLNAEYQEFSDFASKFKVYGPTINRKGVKPQRYFIHYFIISRKRLSRETSKIFKRLLR